SSVSLIAASTTTGVVTVDLAAIEDPLGLVRLVEALETRLAGRVALVRVALLDPAELTDTQTGITPGVFG
ncbi:MAG: hypothetical protein GXP35_00430, partial [Actinobacteria bacterium]|nr:hypothetical protein [Actinomycetota bacterium]